MGDTAEIARGQWKWLLPHLGVHKKFLTGRNCPCPACGGTDRFRFTDRAGDGDYFCNQCGAGKGLGLLQKVHGWSFARAAQAVDEALGIRAVRVRERGNIERVPPPPPPWKPERSVEQATLWLRRYRPSLLAQYLSRSDPELRQWINRERPWGYYPEERKLESVQAMLDAGMGVDWGSPNEIQSLREDGVRGAGGAAAQAGLSQQGADQADVATVCRSADRPDGGDRGGLRAGAAAGNQP